ncbi:MAG: flhF [Proteobacteria bacterium]|nr:flhF [Pseudomonadota bacterium]MBS1171803.1 flhF [Pseudomonadota bacterium]
MNVKRFFAPTAREALRRVKEELGGDAIVLSNRSLDGGVEILALPPDALSRATLAAAAAPIPASARHSGGEVAQADEDFTVSLSAAARRAEVKSWRPFQAKPAAAPAPKVAAVAQRETPAHPEPPHASAPIHNEVPRREPVKEVPSENVMQELTAIRGLIERQLAGFAWNELKRESPVKSRLLGELLEAGFSSALARRLLDHILPEADETAARATLRTLLNRDLLTVGNDTDIIDRGGVYALVGPTGVGKTTTTAKLAARCVVRHGAERVALLTTDGYRIGAHEQLRIYGRILGVAVHAVRDAADLRHTLNDLRHMHMILIDTVGMSQRDRQVAEQTAMLLNAGDVRRLLLLNATARGDTLEDVVRAYSGPDLVGAIVTKVDEAISLAPALDVLIRQELELFYVGNGQRVPEDLHLPNRSYLLHRALKSVPGSSPFRLDGDEAGLITAAVQASGAQLIPGAGVV